jgi:hypothetical protein
LKLGQWTTVLEAEKNDFGNRHTLIFLQRKSGVQSGRVGLS